MSAGGIWRSRTVALSSLRAVAGSASGFQTVLCPIGEKVRPQLHTIVSKVGCGRWNLEGEVAQALTSLPSPKREGARKMGVHGWLPFDRTFGKLETPLPLAVTAGFNAGGHFHHIFLRLLLLFPVGLVVVVTSLASRHSRCL